MVDPGTKDDGIWLPYHISSNSLDDSYYVAQQTGNVYEPQLIDCSSPGNGRGRQDPRTLGAQPRPLRSAHRTPRQAAPASA